MPDRLDELRRQRALVHEHLVWLEREIAAETAKTPSTEAPTKAIAPASAPTLGAVPSISPAARPVTPISTPRRAPEAPAVPADPDALLQQYRVEPNNLRRDVRTGCFIYMAVAFALLLVAIAILYGTLSRR